MSARIASAAMAAVLSACAALAASGTATAQINPDGGPIVIEADALTINNQSGLTVYEGLVNAVQGDTHIQSDRLELYSDPAQDSGAQGPTFNDVTRAVAIGNVYYVTTEQIATGDRADYDVASDTVTLTGNAVVTQGCDVVAGGVVVMNLTTKDAQVQAAPGGRVRTVINDSADEAAAAAGCPQ